MNRVIVIRNGKVEYMARPRKKGERDASGRLKKAFRGDGETVAQIRQTAVLQRIKFYGANENNAEDQLWEDPIGRMRRMAISAGHDSEGLSDKQYQALRLYVHNWKALRYVTGLTDSRPACVLADIVASGIKIRTTGDPDMRQFDREDVNRRAREVNSAKSALLAFAGRGVEYTETLDSLCRDKMPKNIPLGRVLGTVREAANILARHYGM